MTFPIALAMPAPGMSVLLTLALLALIILFHEFGHFVVAKLAGMAVYEFSLGFGHPVLLSFKRGGTQYALRPVPIGGFVRIAGMEPDEDVPHGFDKKPVWARLAVIASGSGMNLVLAVILFWVIGLVFGEVVGSSTSLARVLPGTPAAVAGLHPGDTLVDAGPVAVTAPEVRAAPTSKPSRQMSVEQMHDFISGRPDMPMRLVVKRGDRYLAYHLTPREEKVEDLEPTPDGPGRVVLRPVGRIGVVFADITRPMGFWKSIKSGFVGAYEMTAVMLRLLMGMVGGKVPAAVGGPLQIADLMSDAVRVGWRQFLLWSAVISINIGVINLLPIPALDGSRLVFIAIEGIRRRPIDKRREAIVHLVGFALLLLLLALVTLKDIAHLIDKYVG
ncbi:MAG TPA: M50 family metallopeptidase [Armatimonadota bacterium]|nr:M50 family metallopeptidase [Armatimonadota bacterium]